MKQNNHILLIILMIIFSFITGCSSAKHIHDYINGVCSCGKIDVFNHEHAYNIKKVEATCINREYTKYKCVFCDYEYKEFTTESEKLKHNLINDVCEYCNSTRDSNGILYRFDDLSKEYCVVGVDNPIGEVEILSKYNDFAVTSISDYAFYHCEGIKNIIIPNSVVSIGCGAFCDCKDLINITIPNSITKIEPVTFLFCFSLTSITIPESVTSIGEGTFAGCSSLTSITIPESVTSIGNYAFEACTSLTSITIPKSLTSIGKGAFDDCTSLTSITIPFVGEKADGSGKTHFGYIFGESSSSAYDYYVPTSLKEVIITGGTSIGEGAFAGCSSLTSITIPKSVTSIGNYAFADCKDLINITIPKSVTSIGEGAFSGCSSLSIYCEVMSQPADWNLNWNPDSCYIEWGYNN